MNFKKYWNQIGDQNEKLTSLYSSYWDKFSDYGEWQFWLVLALFVVPLVLLCFFVDRKRIFEVFFFGFTVHILWNYIDSALSRGGYFTHNYFMVPYLPNATNMTASVLPVSYLLLYQFCTNRNQNFFLWTLLLSAFFAFVYGIFEEKAGFTKLNKGFSQFHLFLIDVLLAYIACWATNFLVKVNRRAGSPHTN
ncbi:hypothetical protein [Peribacillus deserti]|uniref:Uncharacterized protein n=1 Tax=Peribacillus deserti TaxID=673318 RepID=A0A2N5M3E2_9BACI|nr:hypothetical protein [Peribacillus deserti]PLT28886.1 hypothetical protein CUU66_16195 [Peribacillus deserti]